MATKSELISDIHLRLSAYKPSDDTEIPRSLIGHWLEIARDAVVLGEAEGAEEVNVDAIDDFYLERYECSISQKEVSSCRKDCRYIISFPEVYFNNNEGIKRVIVLRLDDSFGNKMIKVTRDYADSIKGLDYAKPKSGNLMWYREQNKLIILGLDERAANNTKFDIFFVPSVETAEEDEFPVLPDDLPEILDYVEEIGRRALSLPADYDNDGADVTFQE